MRLPFLQGQRVGRPVSSRAADRLVRKVIALNGWAAIIILAAIFLFLALNSQRAFGEVGFFTMLTGAEWYPTITVPRFGFLPLLAGSTMVTVTALVLSVPVSIAAAVYISEFAHGTVKEVAKAIIEFMAAVPSVVYGFIGLAVVVPWVKDTFEVASGLSALSAAIVLGFMIAPTIVSISEDALHAVPNSLRQGSLALGNTRWQTTYKVVLPSASSGVLAAVMLGMGRAIGETMAVLMLTGNAAVIPHLALRFGTHDHRHDRCRDGQRRARRASPVGPLQPRPRALHDDVPHQPCRRRSSSEELRRSAGSSSPSRRVAR